MQNQKIGSGLSNLGNTCFFNAIMQALLYTQPLAVHLQQKLHSQLCRAKEWCIFCAIEKLWWDSKKSRVVNPSYIVYYLKKIFKKFQLGRQEDSHQFLRYLIQGMQDAETGKLSKDRESNQARIRRTSTYSIFGGRLRTFVQCLACTHHSLTCQRYYDLNIECQKSNSLQEGLQNFFQTDDLIGANKYRCENCKHLSNARKGFSILTLPNILTIQFKRFTNTLRKIGKHIHFPKILNLNKYLWESRKEDLDFAKYELYAVTVHAGSTSYSGHYYSFVKNGTHWYEMNDSNVNRIDQQRVLNQKAYILFYKRIHTKTQSEENLNITEQKPCKIIKNINSKQPYLNGNKMISKDLRQMNGKVYQKQQGVRNPANKDSMSIEKPAIKSPEKPVIKGPEKPKNDDDNRKRVQRKQKDLQQTRRKLSMNIEELKRLSGQKLQIKVKTIYSPQSSQLINQQGYKQKQYLQKITGENNFSASIQNQLSVETPQKLIKRRSKEEAIRNTSIAQSLLRWAQHISYLSTKLPIGSGHRLLRSIYRLRSSEVTLTRNKMG